MIRSCWPISGTRPTLDLPAGSQQLNTFDRGQVDDSLYEPVSVDFTPEVTQTALAKGTSATMVGLALLTVLSEARVLVAR